MSAGTLYVVAVPIGNREDITLRALRILKEVDLVAAEDTRTAKRLLSGYGIEKPLESCHEHNEAEKAPLLIRRLQEGISVALISEAGTPTVSDPGYRLVRTAIAQSIPVVPVPGVSAPMAALSVSGLPTDAFLFVGFLPRKKGKRERFLGGIASIPATLIFYESPQRVIDLLTDLMAALGDREGVLGREMTKTYEEFIRGPLSGIHRVLSERAEVRGECTLLVAGTESTPASSEIDLDRILRERLTETGESISSVVRSVAAETGVSRKAVYAAALKLKDDRSFRNDGD